jgi:hypothetical protein
LAFGSDRAANYWHLADSKKNGGQSVRNSVVIEPPISGSFSCVWACGCGTIRNWAELLALAINRCAGAQKLGGEGKGALIDTDGKRIRHRNEQG